ncbi:MAG: hypothetical protein AAB417_02375 [Patescibacteria group bacterium]
MPKIKETSEKRRPTSFALKPAMSRLVTERAKVWKRSRSSYLEELILAESGKASTIPLRPISTRTPTSTELQAIKKGRASESMTIDDFFAHVEYLASQKSGKKYR